MLVRAVLARPRRGCYFFTSHIGDRSPKSGTLGATTVAESSGRSAPGRGSFRCPHSFVRSIRDRCGACAWPIIVCWYDGNHGQTAGRRGTASVGEGNVLACGRLTVRGGRHALGRLFHLECAELLGA